MKIEYQIIIVMIFLVSASLSLIISNPDEIPFAYLDRINQKAINALDAGDHNDFKKNKLLMKKQLETIISNELDLKTEAYLKEKWNFPFVKDVNPLEFNTAPICEILPNIPIHLQNISKTEQFILFKEKYHKYPLSIDISDERKSHSWVHYGLIAESGNNTASIYFHVDSCSGMTTDNYFLSCRNDGNHNNSNYPPEVIASLQNDEFCSIHLEPWRQDFVEYSKTLKGQMDDYFSQLKQYAENDSFNEEYLQSFPVEGERLGLLNEIIRFAMMGDLQKENLISSIKEYENKFGSLPADLLDLISELYLEPDFSSEKTLTLMYMADIIEEGFLDGFEYDVDGNNVSGISPEHKKHELMIKELNSRDISHHTQTPHYGKIPEFPFSYIGDTEIIKPSSDNWYHRSPVYRE